MNKVLSALLAGALGLALNGMAAAADPYPAAQPADKGGVTESQNQPGAAVSAKEQEYLAALKKCESLTGEKRQKCIDAAKKKAGDM